MAPSSTFTDPDRLVAVEAISCIAAACSWDDAAAASVLAALSSDEEAICSICFAIFSTWETISPN